MNAELSKAAALLGIKGGSKKVPKGFHARPDLQARAQKARRKNNRKEKHHAHR